MNRQDPESAEGRREGDPVAEARQLAWLLDEAVRLPGGFRFGLDGLLGLIPGIGDLLCLLAASRIVDIARRQGVPAGVLVRMAGNIGIDALIGAIPIAGDLFDFGFKANARNVELLEQALRGRQDPPPPLAARDPGAGRDRADGSERNARHSGDPS